jgi:hypothetical protein
MKLCSSAIEPSKREAVEVVEVLAGSDFRHGQFHLERLLLRGEDGTQALGVDAGQSPGGDVLAVVGIAADVGVTHPGLAEALKLVVLPDGGEGDLVVDFADLMQ